ncbi:MAG: NAD(P)H-binding protein [Chloroflexi bacterium]|nr:NAD(P)H-binding protein [Chloroflexota bacterium]
MIGPAGVGITPLHLHPECCILRLEHIERCVRYKTCGSDLEGRGGANVSSSELSVVTGAFGFTGKYITSRLLAAGGRVLNLTGHPDRPNPFGDRVTVAPFHFDRPDDLAERLRGASVLFNTYWIRFAHGRVTHEGAVDNTKTLIRAADRAGVGRIVHVSITNARATSTLPYFRGKGQVEQAIEESGLSYAIIRPALIFGLESILINNIAWLLRRFPLFVLPRSGQYRLQPVHVEDLADLAIEAARTKENLVFDAVGPEVFTFDELVRLIAAAVGRRPQIIHLWPGPALAFAKLIGYVVRDVVLTDDEARGLMANLLVSGGTPTAPTRLSEWLRQNAGCVGTGYASEFNRHYR